MNISRQHRKPAQQSERGASARTRKLMMETATRMMQDGLTPSISDVADAAEVSRATAYRYFPSQSALVEDVVSEALGPILEWECASNDAEARVLDLFDTSFQRIEEFEVTFRAALKLSLENWASDPTTTATGSDTFRRGHRIDLLTRALEPLRQDLSGPQFRKLVQSLSLIFGIEALIVLKDINGLNSKQILEQTKWITRTLVRAAIDEAKKDTGNKPS